MIKIAVHQLLAIQDLETKFYHKLTENCAHISTVSSPKLANNKILKTAAIDP